MFHVRGLCMSNVYKSIPSIMHAAGECPSCARQLGLGMIWYLNMGASQLDDRKTCSLALGVPFVVQPGGVRSLPSLLCFTIAIPHVSVSAWAGLLLVLQASCTQIGCGAAWLRFFFLSF